MRAKLTLYFAMLLLLNSCAFYPISDDEQSSHNQYGGYREACGELPPLIGDDC